MQTVNFANIETDRFLCGPRPISLAETDASQLGWSENLLRYASLSYGHENEQTRGVRRRELGDRPALAGGGHSFNLRTASTDTGA